MRLLIWKRKGDNMDIRLIITMIMGFFLLGWFIFCAIQFIRSGRRMADGVDFTAHVQCEKCHTVYDVTAEDFFKSRMVKSRQITKTKLKKGAVVQQPAYLYYAKKFHCPSCGKRRYGQVLNLEEIHGAVKGGSLKAGVHWLLFFCIGCVVILTLFGIPMGIANQWYKNQVEEMRQQRVEELLEEFEKN